MKVLVTTVVRAAKQGDAHGGLYLVDMDTSAVMEIMSWAGVINFTSNPRGGERGLRGVIKHNHKVYVCSNDTILTLAEVASSSPTTQHGTEFIVENTKKLWAPDVSIHEICIFNGKIYLSLSGYNAIAEYDPESNMFTSVMKLQMASSLFGYLNIVPNLEENNLKPGDSLHLNNIFSDGRNLFLSCFNLPFTYIVDLHTQTVTRHRSIHLHSHSGKAFHNGIVYCDTAEKHIIYLTAMDNEEYSYPFYFDPQYPTIDNYIDDAIASTNHLRGICSYETNVVFGASPASVSLITWCDKTMGWTFEKTVPISNDVRVAVHGLCCYDTKEGV